ncbi:MAG: septal ring lytic transglycosylase RlpA family protein [Proteobacteria bacterium]|nr:septal ring lytic transglycosylase RlpA family protein [Pseudomonadota bacterium]
MRVRTSDATGLEFRVIALALVALLLAACAGEKPKPSPTSTAQSAHPAKKPWKPLGPYTPGGLYAPGVADGAPAVPPDVAKLPEPVPHPEPLSRYGNRSPYVVLGKSYTVLPSAAGYDERGMASWYGTKFDGRVTSSLEPYDLSQFSAAHRTLPLPSYARVTNLENGRSVIVRINDRGPFHDGRLIDLSYAAAIRLGVNVHGTAMVEVQGIDTGQPLPAATADAIANRTPSNAVALPESGDKPRPRPMAASVNSSPPLIATHTSTKAAVASNSSPADDASMLSMPAPAMPATPLSPPSQAAASITTSPIPSTTTAPAPAMDGTPPPTPPPIRDGAATADPATMGFLQVASFGDQANAQKLMQRLRDAGIAPLELVPVQVAGQQMWRVHVGPMRADAANAMAARMALLGLGSPPFFKQ